MIFWTADISSTGFKSYWKSYDCSSSKITTVFAMILSGSAVIHFSMIGFPASALLKSLFWGFSALVHVIKQNIRFAKPWRIVFLFAKIKKTYQACLQLRYDYIETKTCILILKNKRPELIGNDLNRALVYSFKACSHKSVVPYESATVGYDLLYVSHLCLLHFS